MTLGVKFRNLDVISSSSGYLFLVIDRFGGSIVLIEVTIKPFFFTYGANLNA